MPARFLSISNAFKTTVNFISFKQIYFIKLCLLVVVLPSSVPTELKFSLIFRNFNCQALKNIRDLTREVEFNLFISLCIVTVAQDT